MDLAEDHFDMSRICPPEIAWHPGYCVARTDEKSMICYRNEQVAENIGKHLRRIRLDDGFRSFWKYWRASAALNTPQNTIYNKNGQRKLGSRAAVTSYPTYSQGSLKKAALDCLRTDSLPTLNVKQHFSTLRPCKQRNLG